MICFDVTRNDVRIDLYGFQSEAFTKRKSQIKHNSLYSVVQGYIMCNGTPEDIHSVMNGTDDREVSRSMALVYEAIKTKEAHEADEQAQYQEAMTKKK